MFGTIPIKQASFETELGCEINRDALERYKETLKPRIAQIHKGHQNMYMEVEIEEASEVYPREIDYALEKLFSSNDPMFVWGMQEAQKYLNGVVDLYKQNKQEEIQAVARAGLWLKNRMREEREILWTEMNLLE